MLARINIVPGNDPRKIKKAISCAADTIVLDLEDGVSVEGKASAREIVKAFASEFQKAASQEISLRINSFDSGFFEDDMRAIGGHLNFFDSIVFPKIETVEQVRRIDSIIGPAKVPYAYICVETPKAVMQLQDLCTTACHPWGLVVYITS